MDNKTMANSKKTKGIKKSNPTKENIHATTNDATASNVDAGIFLNVSDFEAVMKSSKRDSHFTSMSLEDTLGETQERINNLIQDSVVINDRYNNSVQGIENGQDVQGSFTNYGFSNDTLNWPLWLALYNDSWVFRRAIDKPSQDMINAGFTLYGNRDYTKIYKAYDRYKSELTQLLQWGALFGGSVGVMMFENIGESEMSQPLNKKLIANKRMRLYITDRWYGCSADMSNMVTNMRDIDYGKPKYYDITFANGKTYKIHHSYILRYEHRFAPPLIKKGQLQGWGYAEGAHILNELARDDQLKAAITSLVNKSLIEVIKMSGMRGVFMGTDKGNESQLMKRLEMVNWGRSYNSLTFLDKDDEYTQNSFTGLAGLSEILEKNMWQIAAALEMQGILYGELKGGLSADTDAYKHYAGTIINRSNAYFRPALYKFLKIQFIINGYDEQVDFDFNSLARYENNKDIITGINDLSSMLGSMEQAGIISKYQYAKTVQDYINNGAIKINMSEEFMNKLKLEEQQKILDTIKELSSKGRQISTPSFADPMASMSMQETSTPDFNTTISADEPDAFSSLNEQEQIDNTNLGENLNNEVDTTT